MAQELSLGGGGEIKYIFCTILMFIILTNTLGFFYMNYNYIACIAKLSTPCVYFNSSNSKF